MNAMALEQRISFVESTLGVRVTALEAEVAGLKALTQKQTQFIGEWAARIGGSGSTVEDPEG
jgi:hypothetical protein